MSSFELSKRKFRSKTRFSVSSIFLAKEYDSMEPFNCLGELKKQFNPNYNILLKCPNCGLIFQKNTITQKFCSSNCNKKYYWRNIKILNMKKYLKLASPEMIKNFMKKYNNFAYKQIFTYPTQYHDEMISLYTEEIPRLAFKTRNCSTAFNFLRIAMKYCFLNAKSKLEKEISYYDCNYKNQMQILGEYNEPNY